MWAKRDDCNSGLAYGGNKTRKLEYLVAEALAQNCDTLVSPGCSASSRPVRGLYGSSRVFEELGRSLVTVRVPDGISAAVACFEPAFTV